MSDEQNKLNKPQDEPKDQIESTEELSEQDMEQVSGGTEHLIPINISTISKNEDAKSRQIINNLKG
jgi:hypothetical protein